METPGPLVHIPKAPLRFRLRTPPAVKALIAAPLFEHLPSLNQLVRAPFPRRHSLVRVFVEIGV
jgi:hypothetical protein